MEREVMWTPADGPGCEHLRLAACPQAPFAEGLVIGVAGGRPFGLRYGVWCDEGWRAREVRLAVLSPVPRELILRADGSGRWRAGDGDPLPALDGCVDVDVSATPFTNTLPIRRLGLRPGESAEIAVAYVDVPALTVEAVRQRYTCLETGPAGGRYRFESLPYAALPEGFCAELTVDGDGLVVDYPGLFRRAWSDRRSVVDEGGNQP